MTRIQLQDFRFLSKPGHIKAVTLMGVNALEMTGLENYLAYILGLFRFQDHFQVVC